MKISEALRDAWHSLSLTQRTIVAIITVTVSVMVVTSLFGNIRNWGEIRKYEQEAAKQKKIAKDAIAKANQIALEKMEVEKTIAELEGKINVKTKEANDVHIKTLDAKSEYYRALRESRTDDPSIEQLCLESNALGIACP